MREAFRASVFHCIADPGEHDDAGATEYFEDAVLLTSKRRALLGIPERLDVRMGVNPIIEFSLGSLGDPRWIAENLGLGEKVIAVWPP